MQERRHHQEVRSGDPRREDGCRRRRLEQMSVDGEIVQRPGLRERPHRRPFGQDAAPRSPLIQRLDHADRCVSGSQELDQERTSIGMPRLRPGGRRRGQPFERPAFDRDARRGPRRPPRGAPGPDPAGRLRPRGSLRRPRSAARDRWAGTATIPRAHVERTAVATRRRWSTRWLERLRRSEPSAHRRPTGRGMRRRRPGAPASARSPAARSGAAARRGRRATSCTPRRARHRRPRTGSGARPPPTGAYGRRAALPCLPSDRAPTGTRSPRPSRAVAPRARRAVTGRASDASATGRALHRPAPRPARDRPRRAGPRGGRSPYRDRRRRERGRRGPS